MTQGPRLLDLFCGAGGCAVGYHRAGFDVVGVDVRPMPSYPFAFVQADALGYLREHGQEFHAIHASPPCQRYSVATKRHAGLPDRHPDFVDPVRELLTAVGKPWVIENVVGAPLRSPVVLCGTMFGLRVYRHRLFESSLWNGHYGKWRSSYPTPRHRRHQETTGSHRGYSRGTKFLCVAGRNFQRDEGAAAMAVDWMRNREELAQAIPPAYTEWVGNHLVSFLR